MKESSHEAAKEALREKKQLKNYEIVVKRRKKRNSKSEEMPESELVNSKEKKSSKNTKT